MSERGRPSAEQLGAGASGEEMEGAECSEATLDAAAEASERDD